MKKVFFAMLLALLAAPVQLLPAAEKQTSAMPKVGDPAPDFKMQYFDGHDLKDVSLNDYRGRKQVVLAFYVFAFTGG